MISRTFIVFSSFDRGFEWFLNEAAWLFGDGNLTF